MPRKVSPCRECPLWQVCVGQAELCCQHAHDASKLERFEAARGLYKTAVLLYQRALELGGDGEEIQQRLRVLDSCQRQCEASLAVRRGEV